MALYGSVTPKRHYCYSNSMSVSQLDRGVLSGWKTRPENATTKRTVCKTTGKKGYTATRNLRPTEP